MKKMMLSLMTATLPLSAMAAGPTPPATLEMNSHNEWISQIGAPVSPYADYVFGWYEAQKKAGLPEGVKKDPEQLLVVVDKPMAVAISKEEGADAEVEKFTTFGLETYGLIDANISQVLETILFRWGKPVGKAGGSTFPHDTVFGFREERAAPEWAPNAYKTFTFKRNGGIALDMNDVFAMVVRGNAKEGYTLVGSFIEPAGGDLTTTTNNYITIIYIRPTADGKTDYRVAGMLVGQSYSMFGSSGRKNFGFNAVKIREGQKEFIKQVMNLKQTGKIPERKPQKQEE
jgi:hypothetical protein